MSTKQKANRKVQKSEQEEWLEKLRFLSDSLESTSQPFGAGSPQGSTLIFNEAFCRLTGYTREELYHINWATELTTPESRIDELKALEVLDRTHEPQQYQKRYRRKDGTIIPIELLAHVATDSQGNILYYYSFITDITERKQIEGALMAERQRFNDLLEAMPAYLILLAPDYHVPFANRFFRERFGDAHGRRCYEYLFGRSEPCENCETFKVMKTRAPHHWEWTGPDGHNYDIFDFPFTDTDGSPLIMEMGIDITERKRAEEELRRARDELEQRVTERTFELKRSNDDLITQIEVRRQAEEAREQSLVQLREKTAELENANEELEVKSEELAAQSEEIECANQELRTHNEELQSVTGSLREAQNYLESLINYANAPIIVWDYKFSITRFNHAFERLSGYTADEVLSKDLSILFPVNSREESLNKIRKTLEGEQWESVEIPILHKFGSVRIALWNSANIYSADNALMATIAQGQDITTRKQAEKELEEAKEQAELYLDLMGHDIGNMHQIIMMQLDLATDIMKLEGKLEDKDSEIIHTSARTLEKATRLIDNVRKLQKIRSGGCKLEALDLTETLKDVLKDYASIPGRDISIKYVPDGKCLVRANPLLKDVFSNLVDNAVKHSSDHLEIEVDVNRVGLNGSSYYRVTIEDNGNGIPDEKKEEVFRRFLRGQTKAKGTGLGLYLVKTLVEGFGGYVEIQNRVLRDCTKGTRFLVYLPVIEEVKDAIE